MKLSDFPPVEPASLENAAPDWLSSPCGVSAKSNPLTRANFEAMMDRLDNADPYGKDWEVIRYPHWDVEWLEIIFVRPGSKCEEICTSARASLAKYPCLDEDLWMVIEEEMERAKLAAKKATMTTQIPDEQPDEAYSG